MRDDAFACLRRVGVETGGSNVQSPWTRRRSPGDHRDEPEGLPVFCAGFQGDRLPIAKIALACRRLPPRRDSKRHHTGHARFVRATIDYVVTKIPTLAFEKLPDRWPVGTRMQSVGE